MCTSSHLSAWNISFYHINISFYSKKIKKCVEWRSHFLANLKPSFIYVYFLLAYLYPIYIHWCIPTLCFPGGSDGVESACSAGDSGLITGSGRSPEEGNGYPLQCSWASSLVAQLGKNPPAMRETWIWSLGWEDPLEKGKATLPILA